MAFSKYKRMFSNNSNFNSSLQQLQSRIESSLSGILDKDHLDSIFLNDCALTSGVENLVEHKLEKPVKWMIVSQDTAAIIYENTATIENTSKYLSLITTTDVNVGLIVWV